MTKLFAITGASGHLGNVVVKKLLAQGHKVRVLAHNRQPMFNNSDVEFIYGDVCNSNVVYALCEGCDAVIHSASYISITNFDKKTLQLVNIDGTNNVIDACKAHAVKKLVYVSSVEAIGKTHDGIHSELDGFSPDKTFIYYGYTKALATHNVIQAARNDTINASIICPSGITGPYDYGSSLFGSMVKDYLKRDLLSYPSKGGFCFVDVRDVADAIINAVPLGKNGEHYILSSEYVAIQRIMDILFEHSNIAPPRFATPLAVIQGAAVVIEPWCKLFKKKPVFTSDSVRILRSEFKVVSNNTKHVLQITPRPITISIRDQIAWYQGKSVSLDLE